ncbi:plasmid maintenance system antidote protein, XRE family (plasmid) [Thalassoporum mexicanum PCC 7367]|uniref:HigA family addiction module antitoxin n=1 Tax=Thalassoporum mexicanum TaxID=3457544 RepID=UPI00029FEF7A|nr:HigA family addiction module antitoxin [Pseudanabaena sp. PCC 7367]AFY72092.1 plasmid maintenance system antidote protein, XRE family [Pseudanabaena sp. PCC 7367]
MAMKSPAHPGKIIKHAIESTGLNIGEAATKLGVTRQTLSRVINGRTSLSPEMAIRVSKAFGTTPEHWLRMQLAYDIAQMHEAIDRIQVERFPEPQSIAIY